MKNILITGGTGYIGSHIALELLKSKFNVFIVDNFSNSNIRPLKIIEGLTRKKILFEEGDLREKNFLDYYFKKHLINGVIHCAGLKSVNESIQKPYDYYQNNVIGSINLIEAMRKYQVTKLIFSSSATVYDQCEKMPLSETSASGHGQNPYARSKIMIEKILQDEQIASKDLSVITLRYFNPVGNDSSGLIGENPKGTPNNLMPLLNNAAINSKNLIVYGNDYDTPDGTAIRDYIHVSDLANGHVLALEHLFNLRKKYIVYNLGTGYGTSVLEIIKCYEETNNLKINYNFGPRRNGDVPVSYADNKLAVAELKWQHKHNLSTMCRDSYNWGLLQSNL